MSETFDAKANLEKVLRRPGHASPSVILAVRRALERIAARQPKRKIRP